VALLLTRKSRSRLVRVTSPNLSKQLADFDYTELRRRTFTFGVQGDELCAIFLQLLEAPPTSSLPNDRGIDNQIIEVIRPRAEASNTDYSDATRFVRAASFRAGSGSGNINRVVIHITDGGSSIEGPISWFQNPASGVSAHYIVGQNGEVVQMVRDSDIAWHANSANGDSIGIEHCARAARAQGANDAGLLPTPLQYAASGALVRWLCETYSIPMDRDHILGHSEADPRTTHRGCPAAVWDWDYYMQMLIADASLPPSEQETSRRQSQNQPVFAGGSYD
jgi:N-acetyl-anhydromuramyl-L-alanine amidase AmpD